MMRMPGRSARSATATPAASPPPPMGTIAVSTSGQSCAISSPTVPCPEMMSGSSKGGTIASPSAAAIFSARARRSTDIVPSNTTSAPSLSAPRRFTGGAVVGMTTTARAPRMRAASATPWAWLPEE